MNNNLRIHVGVEEVTFSYRNLYKEAMKDIHRLKVNELNLSSLKVVSEILGMPVEDSIQTVEEYINQFCKVVNNKLGSKLFWLTIAGRDKEAKDIEKLTENYLSDVRRIVLG